MACGCSSSPVTYSGSSPVSNGCGVPSCNCNLPRRSSTPPVVPVLWKDAARFRQMAAGVLVVHCGEEMGSLDSPVSGTVMFDALTQKVYVSGNSVEFVLDYFGCQTDAIYGFPLYGVKPECRDMGENPDRRIAVVRPPNSAFGTIYAHETICTALTGLRPEITPVQLVPDALPEVIPNGIYSVAWIDVPPGEDCTGPRRHYYAVPGEHISSVDEANIRNWDVPATLTSDTEEFGFAAWLLNTTNGKWELQKVSNESMAELIGVNPIQMFDAPYRIYYQGRTDGAIVGFPFSPPLPTPSAFPAVPETITVDLTTIPGWDESYKGVIISTLCYISCVSGDFYAGLTIDGVDHVIVAVSDDGASNSDNNEKFVKFNPASKSIQVQFQYAVTEAGVQRDLRAAAYIVGFFK